MSRSELSKIHKEMGRNIDDDISWALFSLKVIVGDNDFRNWMISHKNKDEVHHLFTMAGEDYSNVDLIERLNDVASIDEDMVTFTVAQKATAGNPTHYIGFVVDKEKERLYIMDPVMGSNGWSYSADEETNVVRNYFNTYDHVFVQPSYTACQTSDTDTYCQSWSLWLMLKFLRHMSKGGRLNIRKNKKGERICSINFFNVKKTINEERRIMVLKRDLFNNMLKMINDDSNTFLTTGVAGNKLDLEMQYMRLRYDYEEFVTFPKGVYNAFYKTKFGRSLSDFGIKKKRGNKLPKTRGDVIDEAYSLLKVMNKYDLLA